MSNKLLSTNKKNYLKKYQNLVMIFLNLILITHVPPIISLIFL